VIPDHARDDILEVRVTRVEEPDRAFVLYTKHKPGRKRADVDLFKLGARYGEWFEVRSVRVYGLAELAEDYNSTIDRPLRNTRLRREGDDLFLEVDGSLNVGLIGIKFRTYQSELIMEAKLDSSGTVKMTKSLGGYCLRLRDTSVVSSIEAAGYGIMLTYAHRADNHPHRRFCELGESEKCRATYSVSTCNLLQATSRPEYSEGSYVVTVGDELRTLIISRLRGHMSLKQYTKAKGDSAEEIIRDNLNQIGLKLVADHPFGSGREDSNQRGPDMLARGPEMQLWFVEVKWWENSDDAMEAGIRQVKRYLVKYSSWREERVTGAYIVSLDWNLESFLTMKIRSIEA
jgi:hypothetical protein